ncbi:unnamed protein product [Ascophyllum nodosum]
MHDEHDGDPNSSEGETDSVSAGHSGRAGAGSGEGGGSSHESGDIDRKRKRRLELNRKAAKESRRRKKMRIEELGRSVVFLTKENQELREQNELLRQMVAAEVPPENSLALSKFQAENAALRMALYESVKHDMAAKQDQGSGINPDGTPVGRGVSLPDHSFSGTLPSLAAAAAAVGPAQGPLPHSSAGPGQSALALLASFPPLPPAIGIRPAGSAPGELRRGVSPMAVSAALQQRSHLSEVKPVVGGSGASSNGRVPGESLHEVGRSGVGEGGGNGSGSGNGGGNRVASSQGMGGGAGSFVSSGPGVLSNLGAGGAREGREQGGRSGGTGGYVDTGAPSMAGGAAGHRSAGPSSQHGYSNQSYALSSLQSASRKLDRGLPGGSAGGPNGGSGEGNGPGSAAYAEMVVRAPTNASMQRVRSMQQHHGGSGGGSRGDDSLDSNGSGGSGRRLGPGGWPPAWGRDGMGSAGSGNGATRSIERGL